MVMNRISLYILFLLLGFTMIGSGCSSRQQLHSASTISKEFSWPNTFEFKKTPQGKAVVEVGGKNLPTTAFDPFILIDKEGYHVFFTSIFTRKGNDYFYSLHHGNQKECDFKDRFGSICYGFSNDKGMTWQYRGAPLIYGGGEGWDNNSIETANVIRVGNKLHLFYSGEGKALPHRFQIGLSSLTLKKGSIRKTLFDEKVKFPRPDKPFVPGNFKTTTLKKQHPGTISNI